MSLLARHPFKNFGADRVAALSAALLLSLLIFSYRDLLQRLEPLGYTGVFLISLIGNATLILPAPTLVLVYIAGGTLSSPLLVGLLAGVGATLGEVTGYLAGFGSSNFVEHNQTYSRVKAWVERFGLWAIGVFAFIPNPLFDLAGFAAGTLGIRLRWFLLATFIGKVLKMTLIAYAGSLSADWIEPFL